MIPTNKTDFIFGNKKEHFEDWFKSAFEKEIFWEIILFRLSFFHLFDRSVRIFDESKGYKLKKYR